VTLFPRALTATLLVAVLTAFGSTSLMAAPLTFNGQPIAQLNSIATTPTASAQRYDPYGYGHHRNQAALTAIMLGAVGAIAGTAVLVYANRPECGVNPNFSGCGYGTKVVGTSVLAGGVVGIMAGAIMWR